MAPIFCFIDDSAFELDVFTQGIIPAAPGIRFVLGSTYDEVVPRFEGRMPALFLLDLYGRDPNLVPQGVPSREDLAARLAAMGSLDDLVRGLDDFPGDQVNEYLKRLFAVVDGWRRLFHQASRDAGQNTRYGLGNLARVRRDYPAAPAVAYTRKSLIMDAVDSLVAGVDGVFLKPNAAGDSAIRAATRDQAPRLIEAWAHVVDARFHHQKNALAARLVGAGRMDAARTLLTAAEPALLADLDLGDRLFLETLDDWTRAKASKFQ